MTSIMYQSSHGRIIRFFFWKMPRRARTSMVVARVPQHMRQLEPIYKEKEISQRSTLCRIPDHDVGEDLEGGPVAGEAEGEDHPTTGDGEEVGEGEDDDHQLGDPEVAAAASAVRQVLLELPPRSFKPCTVQHKARLCSSLLSPHLHCSSETHHS